MSAPRISVFPKCYFDELYSGAMDYLGWLRQAATLGGEGVEHYDGFFHAGVEAVRRTLAETGQISSMLCFSPDFTHPDASERARQVDRQQSAIDLCVALGIRHCRTLSGQRYPGMSRHEGVERRPELRAETVLLHQELVFRADHDQMRAGTQHAGEIFDCRV